MNVRVLIYMNPLTVDKISKKFLWWKDSGFLYTKQLIDSLPDTWNYTILVPKGFDEDFFGKHNITFVEYDYSTSIHQNRYHFNRNIIAKALPYGVDIDVVLNMQPEVAANLRVFFENQRREKPIIINYFHWIDCKESRNSGEKFIWRQAEGANAADLNLFHTEHAKALFTKSARDDGLDVDTSVDYFHPLPTTYGTKPITLPDKKIILFNHRLNNTTGWKEVLKICSQLDRDDFVLWFTDESNLKERKTLELYDMIKVQSVPFESYGYLLSKAHFSVCNLTGYATWNMAVLDSLNHNTNVISNNTPLMNTLGAWTTDNLTYSIKEALNEPKSEILEREPFIDYNLEEYITNEIRDRAYAKIPNKFGDVYDLIKSQDTTEKREYINKFWSFHANSNFQIIRWKLLSEGIQDDTTIKLTTYLR